LGDTDCYVIESIPVNDTIKANSGYSRKVSWIRADNFFEQKVDYYDLGGRLLKTQQVDRLQKVDPEKERWFALHREMINHQTGHRTVIEAENVDAKPAIGDDLFTTRYIERE